MKIVGKAFSGLLLQPQDEVDISIFGERIVRRFRSKYSDFRLHIPPIETPHPTSPLCKLVTAQVRQINFADLAEVQLNYEQDELPGTVGVPPDEISESGSTIEIDIRSHPRFVEDFQPYWDADLQSFRLDAPDYLRGVSKYVVGSGQVAITTFSRTRPSTVQSLLGKRSDPGHGLGEAGHWLVMTGGISKRVAYWGKTLVYQYSSKPVPTEIYDA